MIFRRMQSIGGLGITMLAGGMLAAASSPVSAGVPLNPNSQKYHERNPSAATGRSGSATLMARMLVGKDGQTVVEMTTGALDSTATPPGSIAKAQVKAYDGLGETVFADNYTGLTGGGYFSTTYDKLRRGQPIQLQANIRAIDGKRTDVVTVTDIVKARPDLRVVQLQHPDKARVNTPVNIAAVVTEANGDIGARADCVLYVDGTEADRANGIWVDAADSVSCAFTHTFDTAGTHELRVEAANVVPADWDTSDNAVTGLIQIVSPEENYTYAAASVWNQDYRNYYRSHGYYGSHDQTWGGDWEYKTDYNQHYHYAGYWAWVNKAFVFPVTIRAAVTDGTTTSSLELVDRNPQWSWGSCSGLWETEVTSARVANVWLYSCPGFSLVNYGRYSGSATYLGRYYQGYWYVDGNGQRHDGTYYDYSWFYNWSSYGSETFSGSDFVVSADVVSSDGTTYRTPISIYAHPITWWEYSQPETCYDWTYWYSGRTCYEYDYHLKGSSGWNWGPQQ